MTLTQQGLALAVSVGICLGAAGIGSMLTIPSLGSWYAALRKPRWTPPNWLFGPVWTALYLCMAVAAWLIWRPGGFSAAALPLALFVLQLALNVFWSGIFFRLRRPGVAFLEVVILWISILATTIAFRSVSATASWLMVPYLAWVTYASALNAAVWQMNS